MEYFLHGGIFFIVCDFREGKMGTGDEDTHNFFKLSSVQVLLCPRTAKKGSWVKQQVQFYFLLLFQIKFDVI